MMAPDGVLLYLDEIQYFNKKQQQSLLEFMENGKITLIASTTENPYFLRVQRSALPQHGVRVQGPDTGGDGSCRGAGAGAAAAAQQRCPSRWEEEVPRLDRRRRAAGMCARPSTLWSCCVRRPSPADGALLLTTEGCHRCWPSAAPCAMTGTGTQHYDLLSALQKSIRGSDPDAAVHYLGRLLEAGDLLIPCRRLLVIAAEDVGLAYPQAIVVTKACVDAALQLGLPEARLPLAEAAVLLATAPKSNSAHNAIIAAMQDIDHGKVGPVPRHLQNVHADSAGTGKVPTYKYPHVYPNHYVKQQYLPDLVKDAVYYEYGPNKTEQAAKRYWDEIKGDSASR